jgi:arylformamidase
LDVWPGDVPFARTPTCRIADGASVDLSSIRTTLHLGAHADGPVHYGAGTGIGERPLEPYIGTCQVVTARVGRGARVFPADLDGPIDAPRLIVRTGSFPNARAWNADFAALSPELIHAAADAGVVLIGIDTPSVDLQDSRDLPAHRALAARDLSVLEGLVLDGVPDGLYELIALPLRLVDADASPVRAVLRPLA